MSAPRCTDGTNNHWRSVVSSETTRKNSKFETFPFYFLTIGKEKFLRKGFVFAIFDNFIICFSLSLLEEEKSPLITKLHHSHYRFTTDMRRIW